MIGRAASGAPVIHRYGSARAAWPELPDGVLAVEPILPPPHRRIVWGRDWYAVWRGELRTVRTHPEWGRWSPPPRGVPRSHAKRSGALTDPEWARFSEAISRRD